MAFDRLTPTIDARLPPAPALPLVIRRDNKFACLVAFAALSAVLYLTSNHFPVFEPRLLPMTGIDNWMPFVPETVWIYNSQYFLFLAVYYLCRDTGNLNRYLYAFMGQQTFAVLVFWVWPTTYPRHLFPLPPELDSLTAASFEWLRTWDSPNNCAPSLHVSSCFTSAFVFLHEQRGKFPLFLAWATAVAVSTLTTKQHYVVDIFTGVMLAAVAHWFFFKVAVYRPTGDQAKR